jgi:hypothetical protein
LAVPAQVVVALADMDAEDRDGHAGSGVSDAHVQDVLICSSAEMW